MISLITLAVVAREGEAYKIIHSRVTLVYTVAMLVCVCVCVSVRGYY